MQYSHGGHLLAFSNAVYIEILDPIRMQYLTYLCGHSGLVKNIKWSGNNQYLLTACDSGILLVWEANFK